MKKLLSITLFLLLAFILNAQITITDADFPSAGDTVRYSVSYDLQQIGDPDLTGANYTWDYSSIIPDTQIFVTYLDVSSLPTTYTTVFDNASNPEYQSSWALPYDLPIPPLPGITLENEYLFSKINSSGFYKPGLAAEINGTKTALPYDTVQTMYEFPLNYLDTIVSATTFSLVLPGIGDLFEYRHRTTIVQGWGTIITPYGSFQAIKVKSQINVMDTIVQGATVYPVPRSETEFIWLSTGNGEEIMQIYTSTSTSILYKDIPRPQGINQNNVYQNLSIYPNPCNDYCNIYLTTSENIDNSELRIMDIMGRIVYTESIEIEDNQLKKKIDISNLNAGVYLLEISKDTGKITKKLIIQ